MDQLGVAEFVGRVQNKRVGLFGALPAVEVHFERAERVALFEVHVAFVVLQKGLERGNGACLRHVAYENGPLENSGHFAFLPHLLNALGNHVCNFRTHNFRHFAPLSPEDVSDSLLAWLSIHAHVKVEVFVNEHRQELSLFATQMRVSLGSLVKHNVSESSLHFLDPLKVFGGQTNCLFGVVLKFD